MPRRKRSIPAQAIIAPLSVQSARGGATSGSPACAARRGQSLANGQIGGDPAGDDDRLRRSADLPPEQFEADPHAILDHVDDRRLERGAEVGDVARAQGRRRQRRRP